MHDTMAIDHIVWVNSKSLKMSARSKSTRFIKIQFISRIVTISEPANASRIALGQTESIALTIDACMSCIKEAVK